MSLFTRTLDIGQDGCGTVIRVLGRDRFESTASAERRIHSVSPIDLPLPIPEDPLGETGASCNKYKL